MEKYYPNIAANCGLNPSDGIFSVLQNKYSLSWDEYVSLFALCNSNVTNSILAQGYPVEYMKNCLKKIQTLDMYPTLYSSVEYVPPINWNVQTFITSSYEISTYMSNVPGHIYVTFDNVKDAFDMSVIKISDSPREILITPFDRYFEAYDVEDMKIAKILHYRPVDFLKCECSGEGKSFNEMIYLPKFLSIIDDIHAQSNWPINDAIDVFGNNILHYMVCKNRNAKIEKFINLMNVPNNAGVTPAMKLASTGQTGLLLKYFNYIELMLVDNDSKNILHHFASMIYFYLFKYNTILDFLQEIYYEVPELFYQRDKYGKFPVDYSNYVDILIYLSTCNKCPNPSPYTLDKIFVSPDLGRSNKDLIDIVINCGKKITKNLFIYFSDNVERLEILKENKLIKKKLGDGNTILHIYLASVQQRDGSKIGSCIDFMLDEININETNIYGETVAMNFVANLHERKTDIMNYLIKNGLDMFKLNKFGYSLSSYGK